MSTYDSTVHRSYVNIGNWFLLLFSTYLFLLLQLIGSYGQDLPVYQTVLQETPLGIALFSQAQISNMDVLRVSKFSFSARACIA
jgi:hypothetical protein